LEDIEKYEKLVDDIKIQCDQTIMEEQECDKHIDQIMQQNNKMENDLQHLINDVGTRKMYNKFLMFIAYFYIILMINILIRRNDTI
jgi:archaellum component FlaC